MAYLQLFQIKVFQHRKNCTSTLTKVTNITIQAIFLQFPLNTYNA